jgi:phosphate transport system substrate-binding protein
MSRGIELTLSSKTRAVPVAIALAGSLALAACGASNETDTSNAGSENGAEQLSGTVNGAGSSAQQAAMQGWTAGFSSAQPQATVNYDPVGSGGGREQFTTGGVDFAGSDAPLDDEELTAAAEVCGDSGVFELPNYISAIAVVYNLPGVEELNLSPATVAKIFTGQITTWNDPAITAENPRRPTSRTTSSRPPVTSGRTSPTASGRSRAARPPTAPPA